MPDSSITTRTFTVLAGGAVVSFQDDVSQTLLRAMRLTVEVAKLHPVLGAVGLRIAAVGDGKSGGVIGDSFPLFAGS